MNNTLKANQWLRRFRVDITSNSNRVFANGRQQVEVTITIEPREGQTISEDNLASMQLILIDDDGKIHDLDGDLKAHPERDPRFDYHAASGSVPSPLFEASSNTIRRRFYVTSTLPGGTLSTVHAGIWKDEHNSVETHVAPFQSSVVIESISPLRYHESAFALAMEKQVSFKEPGEALYDTEVTHDVGYFGFKDPNNYIVESIPRAVPSGRPFYERYNWDHPLISFELTNDYSQRCLVTAYAVDDQNFQLTVPGKRFSPRAHQMALHIDHERFYSKGRNALTEQKSLWTLIDRHGSEHDIEFFTEAAGRKLRFRVN